MTILFQLFQDNKGTSAVVGDYIVTPYNSVQQVYSVGTYLNRNFYANNVKVIPKEIVADVIDDKTIELLEAKFNSQTTVVKNKIQSELDFIKTYRIYSTDLYTFHERIKNIEFIPKTLDHLKCLFNAINNRSYKIG